MKNWKNKIILSTTLGAISLVSAIGISIISSSCSSDVRRILDPVYIDIDGDGEDDYVLASYSDDTYMFYELLNKNLENFEFPNLNITSIYTDAFNGCNKLTSIIIPNSVEQIMYRAFSGCVNLSSIILPDKLAKIDGSVFGYCFSLSNITLPTSLTYIGKNAFSSYDNGKFIPLPNLTITVPNETIKWLVINSGFNDESRIIVKSDN